MRRWFYWPFKDPNALHAWTARPWLYVELWLLWKARHCSVGVKCHAVDGWGGVQVKLCIPWVLNVYVTLDFLWMLRWLPYRLHLDYGRLPVQRLIRVSFHDWTLWVDIWREEYVFRHDAPWWEHFSLGLRRGWRFFRT